MDKNKKRPKFLNLFKLRLPVTAILSISHRITGIILSLSMPIGLYLFGLSLQSEAGYAYVLSLMDLIIIKLIILLLVWSVSLHLLAGIRFLLIDIDVGVLKSPARYSAWIVHGLAVVPVLVVLGVWL